MDWWNSKRFQLQVSCGAAGGKSQRGQPRPLCSLWNGPKKAGGPGFRAIGTNFLVHPQWKQRHQEDHQVPHRVAISRPEKGAHTCHFRSLLTELILRFKACCMIWSVFFQFLKRFLNSLRFRFLCNYNHAKKWTIVYLLHALGFYMTVGFNG